MSKLLSKVGDKRVVRSDFTMEELYGKFDMIDYVSYFGRVVTIDCVRNSGMYPYSIEEDSELFYPEEAFEPITQQPSNHNLELVKLDDVIVGVKWNDITIPDTIIAQASQMIKKEVE